MGRSLQTVEIMALADDTLGYMAGEFLDALELHGEGRRLAEIELERLGQILPEPEAWTAVGRDTDAMLLLLAGGGLLSIKRRSSGDREPKFAVTCRALDVTLTRYERDGQLASWQFELRNGDSIAIQGRMAASSPEGATEPYDRAEAFARALAARGGWMTVQRIDPESGSEPETNDDEPSDMGAPAGPGRREQVTDVWGNPITPRRRPC